ncbi:Cytosol aminopeptidase [Candidatus Johnevansia muelleri]|uniref:Probable cytosol aminopeptidase n=1 Tax=Candidatus Johnevansia muelleri TaxID=1495769 RepID=A0A078KHW5_9GAMM|nr:Cytosol aminopeptidase [Candidatus Evansia muelleri]
MKISIVEFNYNKYYTPCLIIFLFKSYNDNKKNFKKFDDNLVNIIIRLIKNGYFTANIGVTLLIHEIKLSYTKIILLIGLGKNINIYNIRNIINTMFKDIIKLTINRIAIVINEHTFTNYEIEFQTRIISELAIIYSYNYNFKNKSKQFNVSLQHIDLLFNNSSKIQIIENAIFIGKAVGEGINYARKLSNLPSNICTPQYISDEALKLSKKNNLNITIYDEFDIKNLGANAIYAVGKGSEQPPRLIIIEYIGSKKTDSPHVLVGKGVTFDTGGISIKPSNNMEKMKFDMCGAASILGTMKTIITTKIKINLVAIIVAAENMPDGKSIKPGDIIKTLNGITVEIINTDAEGRLLLCDALTYAERFKPASVIDIATLTGACVVALGHHAIGLFSNDNNLTVNLIKAANKTWDRVWPMPLWKDYQNKINSCLADIANISSGSDSGAITAACYLLRFAQKYPWAHLDIAGVALNENNEATGRPVGLITQYLFDREKYK